MICSDHGERRSQSVGSRPGAQGKSVSSGEEGTGKYWKLTDPEAEGKVREEDGGCAFEECVFAEDIKGGT